MDPHPSRTEILEGILADLGLTLADAPGEVTITGADPITCSPHRIGDATAAAYAALGMELALLWSLRAGEGQDVSVDVQESIFQLMAIFFVSVNGVNVSKTAFDPNLFMLGGFYRCADERTVCIAANYPHIRDLTCDVLNCPPLKNKIRDAVLQWNSFELEEAIAARGGTCVVVRTREEWAEHPQGKLLVESPLISIEKIGDSPPEPLPPLPSTGGAPLSGVKIIDNGHVIAGPLVSRCMAEYGGNVLRISHPSHGDHDQMIWELGLGKRAAFCDLTDQTQRSRFWELLRESDMYISSYPSLERKGLSPKELAAERPGIVFVDIHAFGKDGPWMERGGFDQLGSSVSGLAVNEGSFENPSLPPTRLLNDYLTGALASAGALEALRRRATEGGSWRVNVNLTRVSMWVDRLGLFSRDAISGLPMPNPAEGKRLVRAVNGVYGRQTYLPLCCKLAKTPGHFSSGSRPLGSSPLSWSDNE
ncbi:hypothetical protein BGX26_011703 [Mortierella sp. AD094]|nr:hypothetical protein BGX26_011703 [Mortierella sp. AD094]